MNQIKKKAGPNPRKIHERSLPPHIPLSKDAAWERLKMELNQKMPNENREKPKMPKNWLQRLLARIIPI